ncbi:hypothetical protein [Pedobacter duraquae]|uniref:Glutathionylspermidine synthase n=1 Tax=Pedobacter duraquae TaxID=425511 RepID=A0A4R6IEN9_9SPHI|nr:hypothetical protein [Pedobacter duraquae]TDO20108.1 hypothetical protein CLV32_3867 [Pedobacter duraquae]
MIKKYREQFNKDFSEEKYQQFLSGLGQGYPDLAFRVAETPIFIPADLKEMLVTAGNEIIEFIKDSAFKALTRDAIPLVWEVPNENDHPHFLAFDFGICKDDAGQLVPMLIELQGFPSLYGFQLHLAEQYIKGFELDQTLTPLFNGLDRDTYIELLREVIVGKHQPHEVALMDLDAIHQKTAIDFFITADLLGIKILSLTDIFKEGDQLFYRENGVNVRLKRIYNRLIFDEVAEEPEIFMDCFDPRAELDVEWVTHPNWFYRISKYTMPFLKSKFVPETWFLNTLDTLPENLHDYVLKPLFSFAGMGVIIDVSRADIDKIEDPENWILQKKVQYEPAVISPSGGVKAEIRLLYLWPDGQEPRLCINLARLSRGKMIGVRYNKDFDWVGGTVGLMEP